MTFYYSKGDKAAVIDLPAVTWKFRIMTEGEPSLFHCPLVALGHDCSRFK